ncbi:MAG: bis-aminopropyl spermidine synthase family protein, partial [Coprobacillaceae bacterium]
MSILENVADKVNIKEGIGAIKQYVFILLCYPNSSVKYISHTLSLPIPIVSAIKKELKKEKLVITHNGISLTSKGEMLVRNELHLKNLNINKYLEIISGDYENLYIYLSMLEEIYQNRPEVDVTIDQSKCTKQTAINRVLYSIKKGYILNQNIVCIGDDDLISVTYSLIYSYLFDTKQNGLSITVIDTDKRILEYIHLLSKQYDLKINCCLHDLRKPIPMKLQNSFDLVITDPPYTQSGLSLFLSRGISCLKKTNALPILLSYGSKPIDEQLVIQKLFNDSN